MLVLAMEFSRDAETDQQPAVPSLICQRAREVCIQGMQTPAHYRLVPRAVAPGKRNRGVRCTRLQLLEGACGAGKPAPTYESHLGECAE